MRGPILLALLLLLAGCASPEEPATPAPPSRTALPTPTTSPTPATAPATPTQGPAAAAPALAQGASWTFAWTLSDTSFVQGSGSSSSAESGLLTIALGEPREVAGLRAYRLDVAGDTKAGARDLAPRWRYLAVDGARLLGSRDGTTLQVVFDGATGRWTGGGFFAAYGDATEVAIRPASLENEYLSTSALSFTRSTQEGGCVDDTVVGKICGDESETDFFDRESYKPGIGPLAYETRTTRTDSGGSFYTAFGSELLVALVATTFDATDGWEPRMPPWTRVAPLATPREGLLAVAVDGLVYAIGGSSRAGDEWTASAVVEVYDPESDSWTAGTRAPVPIAEPAGAAMHGRIYVVDATGLDTTPLFVYDTLTSTWSEGPTLERAISSAHAAAFGDALYVVGTAPFHRSGPSNVAYLYDANEGTWYETDAPPTYRNGYAFASDGRYAYLAGHYYDGRYDGTVRRFDFDPGTWSQGAAMDEPRFGGAGAMVGDDLFVLGGKIGGSYLRTSEAYDTATDRWRTIAAMPTARMGHAAVALDGKVYVIGGSLGNGEATGVVERLDASLV